MQNGGKYLSLHFYRLLTAELVLRVEWSETVRNCRDPFDTKKFSNLCPEIVVEWIAPLVSNGSRQVRKVSFHSTRKTSLQHCKTKDVGSLLLVLKLDDDFQDFDGDISDIV